ncbi:MAG: hypothetical protein VW080_07865, partial [Flavobacteriaceae bacterium]
MHFKKYLPILIILFVFGLQPLQAQFLKRLAKKVEKTVEETVIRKIDEKAQKKTEKTLDTLLDAKVGSKKKKGKATQQKERPTSEKESVNNPQFKEEASLFKAYSKFDFISGEKLIAFEDFSQDEVGDMPAKLN